MAADGSIPVDGPTQNYSPLVTQPAPPSMNDTPTPFHSVQPPVPYQAPEEQQKQPEVPAPPSTFSVPPLPSTFSAQPATVEESVSGNSFTLIFS